MIKKQTENGLIDFPFYSTIALENFLARNNCWKANTNVLDVGTGMGAALHYFRNANPEVRFVGSDHNEEAVAIAQTLAHERGVSGIKFETADWTNLPDSYLNRFDGIVSIHALCCFKRFEVALDPLIALNPRWIAINSLFYDGPLDVLIHIREHNKPELHDDNPDGDFNIFSLPKIREHTAKHGYKLSSEPFYPQDVIPPKQDRSRGTFTMSTELHERTQFSGPVYLPWHFVLLEKDE